MPTNCIIEFNNPNGVFYAGQELSGTVRIENDIEKTIRAISITVLGQAKVNWTDLESLCGDALYKAEENYFSSCTYVVGSAGGSALSFKPGIYEYQFKSALPSSLPTTCYHEYGSIQYYVDVIIDQVSHCNEVFKKGFRVIHVLDLNIDPKYREPQIRNKSKQFRCWSCTSGNVDVTFTIPAIGFVPGELINFNILVENGSSDDVNNVTAYILQEVQFTSTVPKKKIKRIVEKIEINDIGKIWKSTKKLVQHHIIVPEIPTSTIDTSCKCIQIEYYFFVVAETGCCSTNLELFTKIFIGTTPVYNNPTDIPITTQPTMTQNTPLLPTILEKNTTQSYNTFN